VSEPVDCTYRFQPAPTTYAAWTAAAAIALIPLAVLVSVDLGGIGTIADVLWAESFCLALGLAWGIFWTLTFRLGAGISLSRDMLVVQQWPSTKRIYLPWKDIRSIRLESWMEKPLLIRLWARLWLGRYFGTPFVTIETRKMISMPVLIGRTTTRRLGFPAGKLFRCYLADPEGFVRHTREFMSEEEWPTAASTG